MFEAKVCTTFLFHQYAAKINLNTDKNEVASNDEDLPNANKTKTIAPHSIFSGVFPLSLWFT